MSIKPRGPLILATLQVVLATQLLYWDHAVSHRSLWDAWSLPAGLLLIVDFPASTLTLPLGFFLRDHELLMDVVFLCMVFLLWSYIGFLLRSPRNPKMTTKLWWGIRLTAATLAIAAGFLLVAGLSVSSLLKFLVVAFWTAIVGLISYRRVHCTRVTRAG